MRSIWSFPLFIVLLIGCGRQADHPTSLHSFSGKAMGPNVFTAKETPDGWAEELPKGGNRPHLETRGKKPIYWNIPEEELPLELRTKRGHKPQSSAAPSSNTQIPKRRCVIRHRMGRTGGCIETEWDL